MSRPVIEVRNLSKVYRLGTIGATSLKEEVGRLWAKARRRGDLRRDGEFWALRDVSFEVQPGEVVGIIGRNGAGKSTLLKILSRITQQTHGEATLRGRVASLLEVGTGFHPDLTGRENIFLNGTILGMRKAEVARKLDAIVSFAEIEKFIDTPVKRYSSGMYVRLAFAVAAHLEPEILVVDEVLAVGDAGFQKKCLGKMDDVSKEGRTVIFVSHDMGAVKSLTHKCIYLSSGEIELYGSTEEVIRQYLGDVWGYVGTVRPSLQPYHRDPIDEAPVHFSRVWVDEDVDEIPIIEIGQNFRVFAEIESVIDIEGANWSMILKRRDGGSVLVTCSLDQDFRIFLPSGRHIISCTIRNLPLSPGDYIIQMGINQSTDTLAWDVVMDYPILRVADRNGEVTHWTKRQWGAVHWRDVEWAASPVTGEKAASA